MAIPPPPPEEEVFGKGVPPPPPEEAVFGKSNTPGMWDWLTTENLDGQNDLLAKGAKLGQAANKKLSSAFDKADELSGRPLRIPSPIFSGIVPGIDPRTAAKFIIPENRLGVGLTGIQGASEIPGIFSHVLPGASKAIAPLTESAMKVPESAWQGAKNLAAKATETAGKLYSGIKPASYETLRGSPEATLAAARKGMTVNNMTNEPIPVALQEAQDSGRKAQKIINDAADGAGKKYKAMMDWLGGPEEKAQKFDVAWHTHVLEDVKYPKEYAVVNAGPETLKDKAIYDHYHNWIKNSGEMNPKDVADFLRDATRQQKAAKGSPLSANLEHLKEGVLEALPGEYSFPETLDTMNPRGTGFDIRGTRDEYKAAKQLQRDLGTLAKSDDPIRAFETALRKGGQKAERLKEAVEKVPGLKEALGAMSINKAGADFAPKIGALPRTGLVGGALAAAGKVLTGSAAGVPAVAATIVGASPRLNAELLANYGPRAAKAIEGAAGVAKKLAVPATLGANNLYSESPDKAQNPYANKKATELLLARGGVNPKKSGGDSSLLSGLPKQIASNSGKLSLDDLTKIWHENGIIPDEDNNLTLEKLKTISKGFK